ncbi:MAG: PKD domain-containing protein, partial [Nanoarchaeota archaeon]
DCSSECIIPIKIISGANQSITLNNLALTYNQQNVGQLTETKFYDLETEPAKVTSGFGKLYIDQAGFSVPSSLNNYTFFLRFNSQTVFSERIEVKDVPIIQSVTPTQSAAGFPQDFIARVSSGYNLTSFSWDFGDGTAKVTTLGNSGNKTTHTYSQIGEYTLRLNVTDQRRLSNVKTFTINVSSPADLIEINLAQLKTSLTDIKADIASLDFFSKAAINASLGLSAVESSINNLQTRYNNATEEQLSSIVVDLLKLRLPGTISKTKSSVELPFIPAVDKVNLNALERIGGETISGNEDEYVNAAAFWAIDNLDATVDFNEFSGRYGNSLEPITKTFKIKAQEARDISYDYYLIMPVLDGFYSEFPFSNDEGYIYINLKDYDTVSFSTTEDIDFTDLPAFISPAVSKLSLGEITLPEEKKTNKWLIFGLVLLALLVIGAIVYIVLQQWYKRKYENHLFPNRNDLYNMAHYINNAKKKEMTNSNIESNLKKVGWSAEKIRYAMRKYAGKRTGMLEIPITKIVGKVEERTKK